MNLMFNAYLGVGTEAMDVQNNRKEYDDVS